MSSLNPQQLEALELLGLKPQQLQQWREELRNDAPWRIARVDRGECNLLSTTPNGTIHGCRALSPRNEAIAVGDWVMLEDGHGQRLPQMAEILQRNTVLRRAAVGQVGQEQLIAANLDVAWVLCAFGETSKLSRRLLNARRLERFIWAAKEGGIDVVVLANKRDLRPQWQEECAELQRSLGGTPVIGVSAENGSGLESLAPSLVRGKTVGLIGSSGVGKSTLINQLLGKLEQATQQVSSDGKGRHTTTRRELMLGPWGGQLIDTPGMREMGVLGERAQGDTFLDIAALAVQCRFQDCNHDKEPGCAVTAAIQSGDILPARVRAFQALQADARSSAAAGGAGKRGSASVSRRGSSRFTPKRRPGKKK